VGATAADAQRPHHHPDIQGYEDHHFLVALRPQVYADDDAAYPVRELWRLDSLMRAGNIYLSLQDAIALALEKQPGYRVPSLRSPPGRDRPVARIGRSVTALHGRQYSRRFQLSVERRSCRDHHGKWRKRRSSGQSGILSGFSIQAAGSNIPNLEPLLFVSYQASHQTRPLTNSVSTGTNYLVSSARTTTYGIQKSFLTGTRVTVDLSQQSLGQNAPANSYNPSLNGNAEISISQPLLQGFGLATNRRTIDIAKNNMTVADLNFKAQVIATVKNVIDLYWDLVSLNDNLRASRRRSISPRSSTTTTASASASEPSRRSISYRPKPGVQTAQLDLRQAGAQALQQELILKSALTRTGIDSVTVMDAHIIPTDSIQCPNPKPSSRFRIWWPKPPQPARTQAHADQPGKLPHQHEGREERDAAGLDVFVDMQNNALAGSGNTLAIRRCRWSAAVQS